MNAGSMIVGLMRVELAIDWAESLKDKRRVVKSLKDALHRRHMVSVSEVGDLEILNRAALGVTLSGNSGARVGVVLDRVLNHIRSGSGAEIVSCSREILHGWAGSDAMDRCVAPTGLGENELLALEQEMLDRGDEALDSAEALETLGTLGRAAERENHA